MLSTHNTPKICDFTLMFKKSVLSSDDRTVLKILVFVAKKEHMSNNLNCMHPNFESELIAEKEEDIRYRDSEVYRKHK